MTEHDDRQDARLDKIRKILAKAERTNNPEEAKTFTEAAQRLMTEWAIDEAMLQAKDAGVATEELAYGTVDIDYSPYQSAHEVLLGHVAHANNCELFFTKTYDFERKNSKGRPQQVSRATLFGFPRDIEFTKMLYTSLLLQQEQEFRSPKVQFDMEMETSHPGHRIRWRNSFNLGYARGIKARLWKANQEVAHEADAKTPGTSLVLLGRAEIVQSEFKARHSDLKTTTFRAGGYGTGVDAGKAAAGRADLGNPRVGQGTKGAIGR